MNGKLHTDDYQYRLNQLHRDDAMRAAERNNLARTVAQR